MNFYLLEVLILVLARGNLEVRSVNQHGGWPSNERELQQNEIELIPVYSLQQRRILSTTSRIPTQSNTFRYRSTYTKDFESETTVTMKASVSCLGYGIVSLVLAAGRGAKKCSTHELHS
jgi:hypothetical protein